MSDEMKRKVIRVNGEREVLFESMPQALKRIKRTIIETVLESCEGNRTRAAQRLGISRPNLQKTMKRLGIS